MGGVICHHFSHYPSSGEEGKGNKEMIDLEPVGDNDNVWILAFEKNFGQQNLFNNMVKEALNTVVRNIGWMALNLFFYGGERLFF